MSWDLSARDLLDLVTSITGSAFCGRVTPRLLSAQRIAVHAGAHLDVDPTQLANALRITRHTYMLLRRAPLAPIERELTARIVTHLGGNLTVPVRLKN